jgi:hypothetical protein
VSTSYDLPPVVVDVVIVAVVVLLNVGLLGALMFE